MSDTDTDISTDMSILVRRVYDVVLLCGYCTCICHDGCMCMLAGQNETPIKRLLILGSKSQGSGVYTVR